MGRQPGLLWAFLQPGQWVLGVAARDLRTGLLRLLQHLQPGQHCIAHAASCVRAGRGHARACERRACTHQGTSLVARAPRGLICARAHGMGVRARAHRMGGCARVHYAHAARTSSSADRPSIACRADTSMRVVTPEARRGRTHCAAVSPCVGTTPARAVGDGLEAAGTQPSSAACRKVKARKRAEQRRIYTRSMSRILTSRIPHAWVASSIRVLSREIQA